MFGAFVGCTNHLLNKSRLFANVKFGDRKKYCRLLSIGSAILIISVDTLFAIYGGGEGGGSSAAFASHSFEAGVQGSNIADNTQVMLDGLVLPPTGVLPV